MFRTNTISEEEIFEVLANRRRRETIRQLESSAANGPVSLHELSKEVAARETEQSPPPTAARESVYNSLHQTHLPKLHELGVVEYDRENRTVRLRQRARDIDRYMEVVTGYGVTWSEIYRTLGVLSLCIVLAALTKVPLVASIDPILWSSLFLTAFAVTIGAQLWSNRWLLIGALRG